VAKNICSIDGCEKTVVGRSWCGKHYGRWRRHGDTTALIVRHEGGPEQRFWAKVEKTENCWNWTARTTTGYGVVHGVNGKKVLAHRFAYELLVGPIPDGMQIDHRCHNRSCVNPGHLRLATNKQNTENHQGARSDSSSGIRGVSWHRASQMWIANVNHNGHAYRRYFHNREDAETAVIDMRNELHTFNDKDRA
jgi:hypothetical protein